MKAKKWILNKDFCGQPTEDNLSLVEFEIPEQLEENGWVNVCFLRNFKNFL